MQLEILSAFRRKQVVRSGGIIVGDVEDRTES